MEDIDFRLVTLTQAHVTRANCELGFGSLLKVETAADFHDPAIVESVKMEICAQS